MSTSAFLQPSFGLLMFFLTACNGPPTKTVSLEVYSSPSGASIYQNGVYFGEAPTKLVYNVSPEFHSSGSMRIDELYAIWPSGAHSSVKVDRLFKANSSWQQVTFRRVENHPNMEMDLDHARRVDAGVQLRKAQQEQAESQRLQNLNNYLQQLPGGTNYSAPKSCPWLTTSTSDSTNTYCIYECTDGTTKTVTQMIGMPCI